MNIEQARALIGHVSAETVAARFNCTTAQAKEGFLRTAKTLREIANGCERNDAAGKKRYSGYAATPNEAKRLRAMADDYEGKAK